MKKYKLLSQMTDEEIDELLKSCKSSINLIENKKIVYQIEEIEEEIERRKGVGKTRR